MSERRASYVKIEVDPQIRLALHQSEIFGPRSQFYLTLDKLHTNIFSGEQARQVHEAFGRLLAVIDDEQKQEEIAQRRSEGAKGGWEIRRANAARLAQDKKGDE